MFGCTIVKEKSRDNYHGYTTIQWYCVGCAQIMNLPQQQEFNYCFHCGRKVIQKISSKKEKQC